MLFGSRCSLVLIRKQRKGGDVTIELNVVAMVISSNRPGIVTTLTECTACLLHECTTVTVWSLNVTNYVGPQDVLCVAGH